MYSVSVAMAVYNGEKYLREQIDSILKQLSPNDELVISYNESTDSTWQIINTYKSKYSNIKIYNCEKKGILQNFQNAILHCSKDIIFLSDQDDVWNTNKIHRVLEEFTPGVGGVVHDAKLVDENLKPIQVGMDNETKRHLISPASIIWQNQVQGSCLAFKRKYVNLILPFPFNIPMHDSWIGLIISKYGKLVFISDQLLLYRQHTGQATTRKHKPFFIMLKYRLNLVIPYMKRINEIGRHKRYRNG